MSSIKFHRYQTKAMVSEAKILLLFAGKQGGKTTAGILTFLYRAQKVINQWKKDGYPQHQKPKFAIVVRRESDFKNVILPVFESIYPQKRYKVTRSTLTITLKPHNIVIQAFSAHEVESIEGITVDGILMDEVQLMDERIWAKVLTRVAVRKGFIIGDGTADGGWVKEQLYDPWQAGKIKNMEILNWESIENPGFSKVEFKRLKDILPQEMFEMLYMGKFTSFTGNVYPFTNDMIKTIEDIPTSFDTIIGGIDFGFATPAAIVVIGINNGIYYVLEELKKKRMDDDEFSGHLLRWQNKYQVTRWYADPSDPTMIKILSRAGVKVRPGHNSVSVGISTVRSLVKTERFFMKATCDKTIQEFKTYNYTTNADGVYIEKVRKYNDHLMDAIRYAVYTHPFALNIDVDPQNKVDLESRANQGEKMHYTLQDILEYSNIGSKNRQQKVYE